MRESYGFSALFEQMEVNKRREQSEDTIMKIASGTMESSLIGDDVISALGISDEGIPTGMDDYEDMVDDTLDDPGMKKLDDALNAVTDGEDEEDPEAGMEALDATLESIIIGV